MLKYNHVQGSFKSRGNVNIAYQGWTAEKNRALVIIVHGLGEHSGRYSNILNVMGGKKISFFAMDNRGHGNSDGTKGHIDSFIEYVYDLRIFANMIKDANPGLPLFLLGHSLGGAIACRYALTYQDDISGLILSSPLFTPSLTIPAAKQAFSGLLSAVTPSLLLHNEINPSKLSHDPVVVKEYSEDPLVHSKISPRLYTEMLANADFCIDHAFELNLPVLVFHGTADDICSIKGSESFINKVSSTDKKFAPFDNLYHETMNETLREKAKVLSLVASWIISHIQPNDKKRKAVKNKKPAVKAKTAKTAKKAVKKTARKSVKSTKKTKKK